MKVKPPEAVLIISPKKVLANAIATTLTSITEVAAMSCYDQKEVHKYFRYLKRKKQTPILLVGFEVNEVDNLLWTVLRAEKNLLNPIIVIGFQPLREFKIFNPVFFEGGSKYHKYFGPPWHLLALLETIQSIGPLYDDNVRDYFFRKFGQSDLYDRIVRVLHDFKGVDSQKDIIALENALRLAMLLDDKKLSQTLYRCLDETTKNRQGGARFLKPELLDLINNRSIH